MFFTHCERALNWLEQYKGERPLCFLKEICVHSLSRWAIMTSCLAWLSVTPCLAWLSHLALALQCTIVLLCEPAGVSQVLPLNISQSCHQTVLAIVPRHCPKWSVSKDSMPFEKVGIKTLKSWQRNSKKFGLFPGNSWLVLLDFNFNSNSLFWVFCWGLWWTKKAKHVSCFYSCIHHMWEHPTSKIIPFSVLAPSINHWAPCIC